MPRQALMRKSIPCPVVLMMRGRRVRGFAAGNPPPSKQFMSMSVHAPATTLT